MGAKKKLTTKKMERKTTKKEYQNELTQMESNSAIKRKLTKLMEMSQANTEKKFDNINNLLANEELIWNSFEKIKKNKGSLTPGTEKKETADEWNGKIVEKISENIKKAIYEWRRIRRKNIPKPGQKKTRPLGIPNFDDRIVQENIRIVLNIIYEPIFQILDVNHGFRPERSPDTAITKIREESQGMTHAIEGDFEGAYDNVNRKKLIEIIKKKIDDKKVITLIKNSLNVEIEDEKGNIITTNKGLPQGSIASPILFNIYLQEFDEQVIAIVMNILEEKNKKENRMEKATSKKYEKARTMLNSIRRSIKNEYDAKIQKYKDHEKFKEKKAILRKRLSEKRKTEPTAKNKRKLFFSYTRYADDWIILTNAEEETCKEIKERITELAEKTIEIKLNQEKTRITNMEKEPAKFLGFSLKNTPEKKFSKFKVKNEETLRKRRINIGPRISIDYNRVLERLRKKKIINQRNQPIHSTTIRILKTWQIVEKFSQIIRGIVNYYYHNITNKSEINYIHYLIKYSCLKTIANREKISMRKVITKYGDNLKIKYEDIIWKETEERTEKKIRVQTFPTYQEIMQWASNISQEKSIDRFEEKKNAESMRGKTFKNSKRTKNTLIEIITHDEKKNKKRTSRVQNKSEVSIPKRKILCNMQSI